MISKKSSLYQRAARLMLGSLVNSDFGDDDLRKIAREFGNGNFSHPMYVLIEDVVHNLKAFSVQSNSGQSSEFSTDLYDIVKRKRLSKSSFASIANEVVPRLFTGTEVRSLTLDRLIDAFLSAASADQERHVRAILEGSSSDQFLKGIMKR